MILILADSTDPWGVALARQLTVQGAPYLLQDPGQMRSSMLDQTSEWVARVTGVYRGMSRPVIEDVLISRSARPHRPESDWLAELNALPCPVVNRLSPGGEMACHTGSPVWEAVVLAHGFHAPRCYAAANRAEALSRLDLWDGPTYVKPAGMVQGGLVLPADAAKAHVNDLAPEGPVFLAQVSPGQLISLFVVGERVVATVVRRGTRSEAPIPPARLGRSLLQRCSDLVLALGLVHAECLLSLSADGQIACLDVLAAPSFWTCPLEVQQQVVHRLAGYLAERNSLPGLMSVTETEPSIPADECIGAGVPEDH